MLRNNKKPSHIGPCHGPDCKCPDVTQGLFSLFIPRKLKICQQLQLFKLELQPSGGTAFINLPADEGDIRQDHAAGLAVFRHPCQLGIAQALGGEAVRIFT